MVGEPILTEDICGLLIVAECESFAEFNIDEEIHSGSVQLLSKSLSMPVLELVSDGPLKIDESVYAQIQALKRRSLILIGGLLEGAITQIALTMLLEGYDVYVCADRVRTSDSRWKEIYFARIRSCAGHVVTWRQVLFELLSREHDDVRRDTLLGLLRLSAAG